MKLTLELTDDQVAALRTDLRISFEDWNVVRNALGSETPTLDYALRIVRVRRALGMSNANRDACYDYVVLPSEQIISTCQD